MDKSILEKECELKKKRMVYLNELKQKEKNNSSVKELKRVFLVSGILYVIYISSQFIDTQSSEELIDLLAVIVVPFLLVYTAYLLADVNNTRNLIREIDKEMYEHYEFLYKHNKLCCDIYKNMVNFEIEN